MFCELQGDETCKGSEKSSQYVKIKYVITRIQSPKIRICILESEHFCVEYGKWLLCNIISRVINYISTESW
jgi:hypothetical protein